MSCLQYYVYVILITILGAEGFRSCAGSPVNCPRAIESDVSGANTVHRQISRCGIARRGLAPFVWSSGDELSHIGGSCGFGAFLQTYEVIDPAAPKTDPWPPTT